MNFGLPENTINKIKTVFEKHSEIDEVVIYGSRAIGNFRAGSDIDITLKRDELQYDIISKINQEIDNLNTPYLFDISIYKKLKFAWFYWSYRSCR